MESNQEHETRERIDFNRLVASVGKKSLRDRQEARAEFLLAMIESPEIVAERIGWIINGSYGAGGYFIGREVLANKRMNRAAWFTQIVAAVEWQCPTNFAVDAYKKLTAAQRAKLDAAVKAELKSAEREIAGEEERHPTKPRKASKNGARRQMAYGDKRDYPKIDLYADGQYAGTTTWSRTLREAKARYVDKNPGARRVTAQFQSPKSRR